MLVWVLIAVVTIHKHCKFIVFFHGVVLLASTGRFLHMFLGCLFNLFEVSSWFCDPCGDLSESPRCCTPLVVIESVRGGGLLASVDIDSFGEGRWFRPILVNRLSCDDSISDESESVLDLEEVLVSTTSSCKDITYSGSGKTKSPDRLFEWMVWVINSHKLGHTNYCCIVGCKGLEDQWAPEHAFSTSKKHSELINCISISTFTYCRIICLCAFKGKMIVFKVPGSKFLLKAISWVHHLILIEKCTESQDCCRAYGAMPWVGHTLHSLRRLD